jgi:biopolymer transport protein ExbD
MRNTIKSLFAVLLLLSTTTIFAQQQMPVRSPEERAQRQTMWMQKNLGLTEEQNKKVYDIMLYHAQQADADRSMAPGPDKKMEKKELKRDVDAELRATLTGDQYQRYQQHVQEMKARRQGRQGGY